MDENMDSTIQETPMFEEPEFEELLPDGWGGGENEDFFSPDTWAGTTNEPTDAAVVEEPGTGMDEGGTSNTLLSGDALTTGLEPETGDTGTPEAAPETVPTTETSSATPQRLRFKARVDHQDRDVELEPDELPTLYQKAQVTDRVQQKLDRVNPLMDKLGSVTKALGYESEAEMLDGVIANLRSTKLEELKASGIPDELAEDYVNRTVGAAAPPKADALTETPASPPANQRDFKSEVAELLQARPSLKGQKLPDEVIQTCVKSGKRLSEVYNEYEANSAKAELETLRKENQTLKQNAASAAKAPVTGVSRGGATDTKPNDPFLDGFNSDDW